VNLKSDAPQSRKGVIAQPKPANLIAMLRASARLDTSRDSSGSNHDGASLPSVHRRANGGG